MDSIRKANESSAVITASNGELAQKIYAIDRSAEEIRSKSSEILESMERISANTALNCEAAKHVTEATRENSAGTADLVKMVDDIKAAAEHLNEVISS